MAQQPGYRGIVSGSAPGGTNCTVTLPSATKAGDWLVVFGQVDYGPASVPKTGPTGNVSNWLVRMTGYDTSSNGLHFVVGTAKATADGASVLTFPNPSSASADVSYLVVVVNGATVDPTTPFTIAGPTATGVVSSTAAPVTAPAVTPPTNNSLVLWAYAIRTGSLTVTQFTNTTNKLAEKGSRTYVTGAVYGVYTTSQAQRAALTQTVATNAVWAAGTIVVNGAPDAPTTPTAPKISTLTDRFTSLIASLWPTRNYSALDTLRDAASIQCTMTNGQPNYATWRSAEAYSFLDATFSFRIRLAPDGGTANAQAWIKQPDSQGVGRVGFELRVTALGVIALDFIGQGANYAPLGTTESVPYDQHVHRWCRLDCSAAGVLTWYTSVDGVNWTSRRTGVAAPTWMTTRNDLAASFEGFRTAGTSSGFTYAFVVDDVNLLPEAAPTFTPLMTGGAVLFAPNWAAADNVAAGYTNNPDQRQSRTSGMGDTGVPYPVPILDAPYGRSGRAMPFRIPDDYRRLEVTPPTEYADGDYLWVGFSFLVEGDMDRVAQRGGYYQIIWQLHHASASGLPLVGLEVRDSRLIVAGGSNRPDPVTGATNTGNTYRYERYLTSYGEVVPGRWIDVVMAIGLWSAINSGRLDIWVDGVQHLTNYVPKCGTNLPGDGDVAYPKHGIYHDGSNRGCTVWFADYEEGTSYAAVAPPAGKVSAFGDQLLEF